MDFEQFVILLQHSLSQIDQYLIKRKTFLMYFLQKCRIWTKMNVVLINQSHGEEDPVVPATQLDMLPAFSRTVTAHFSRLCYFCSLILNFPFGGVCWAEKAGAGQRVTAVSKQHTVNFPLVVCFLSGHTAPAT